MQELRNLGPSSTPQSEPLDPRQVENHAGGYVYQLGALQTLRRFLILGTAGGTYYASERDHTLENLKAIRAALIENPAGYLDLVEEISLSGLAPKNDQALFALALACSPRENLDVASRARALAMIPAIARTGTHLFQFLELAQEWRGWGPAFAKAVSRWYEQKDPEKLAYQLVKYRQRGGWTHRDVLRLAHPKAPTPEHRALYDFTCGREHGPQVPPAVSDFILAQAENSSLEEIVRLGRLPWEALPNDRLTPAVWRALLAAGALPLGALVRQLPTLTRNGVLADVETLMWVRARLRDEEEICRARIHPYNVLVALETYKSGRSQRGSATWVPISAIVDELDAMFYLAFQNVEPAGKRTLIAVDCSGSMDGRQYGSGGFVNIGDGPISPRLAAAAMAMVTAATEPACEVVGFSSAGGWRQSGLQPVGVSARRRLDDNVAEFRKVPMGATDCALPMVWARENGRLFDTFIVMTDNETWSGAVHPVQALRDYRRAAQIDAKLIVVGMTSTHFTIADRTDPGMLDVVGFDASAPALMAHFSAGRV